MAEALKKPQFNNLWGKIAQQSRKDVTQNFSYDPELVAAIIKADINNIKQIEAGTYDQSNELSFKQYDHLVRTYGLKVLQNPVLFAALLAEENL